MPSGAQQVPLVMKGSGHWCQPEGGGSGGLVAQSCLTLVTPPTAARQAPVSMGFTKQENLSGLPFPSPGALPNPGIKFWSPVWQVSSYIAGGFLTN